MERRATATFILLIFIELKIYKSCLYRNSL